METTSTAGRFHPGFPVRMGDFCSRSWLVPEEVQIHLLLWGRVLPLDSWQVVRVARVAFFVFFFFFFFVCVC